MKKKVMLWMLIAMMITGNVLPVSAENIQEKATPNSGDVSDTVVVTDFNENDVVADEVLITLKSKQSESAIESTVEKSLEEGSVECLDRVTVDGSMTALISVDTDADMKDYMEEIGQSKQIEVVQPNYRYKSSSATNDPYNKNAPQNQFYLTQIQAEKAWEYAENLPITISKTKIAVIDEGADMNHEDLQACLNKTESVRVFPTGEISRTYDDEMEHGTHVSGIIAGTSNNGKGIAGVAAGTKNEFAELVEIDAIAYEDALFGSYFTSYTLVTAINYAVSKNCKLINMSLGGEGTDILLEKCILAAYDENGVICVCAAGNEGTDARVSPSDCANVISVINVNRYNTPYAGDGLFGGETNYGLEKDISAPGAHILSTLPGQKYGNMTGTSMATPMVTGVLAMMYGVNPDLTVKQARNILLSTAKDIGKSGFDVKTGYGLVDAYAAVQSAYEAKNKKSVPGETISIKANFYQVNPEGTYQIESLVSPAISTEEPVWESKNTDVATVNQNGVVTSVHAGVTEVSATLANGKAAIGYVEVGTDSAPTSVEIAWIPEIMYAGQDDEVWVNVSPADNCDETVSYESSDTSVLSVEDDGTLHANKEGKSVITVETYNGKMASKTVTVGPAISKITYKSSVNRLQVGKTAKFQYQLQPENASAYDPVTYQSSNSTVASVSADGTVKAKKAGKTFIIATSDSGRSVHCRLTVYKTDYAGKNYKLKVKTNTYQSLKLTWKAIANADGYIIEQKQKGSYHKIATVSGDKTSYVHKKLKFNTTYQYRIRAYYEDNGKQYCGYSLNVKGKVVLPATILQLKNKKKAIMLSWAKIKGADGYIIYRKAEGKGTYQKLIEISSEKVVKYKDQYVQKGVTYSYMVKPYKRLGNKLIIGKKSNTLNGKIK